jgi:hypothetical protein
MRIMSRRHSIAKLYLAAGGMCLISCSIPDATGPRSSLSQKAISTRKGSSFDPQKTNPDAWKTTILVREWWFRDGREYRDRNGDGIVDWEATGEGRYTDDFGVYKEDNNYDGYYEREYESGGACYTVNYDKEIREHVPHIHRVYRPTRTIRKSKAEQTGTGQPATRPVDEPEGSDKPQPEAEGRSR